jgi:hypothetical protein
MDVLKMKIYEDTSFSLSIIEFQRIVSMLLALDTKSLSKAVELRGKDGNSSSIAYGNSESMTRFNVWSPDYKTKKRGLETLLNSMNQVLLTAYIKPKDVWGQ